MQYKNIFTVITFSLLALNTLSSQTVNIPDANFKNILINHATGVDTNFDGEIQVSEAQAYTGFIDVSGMNISSVVGIEEFTNLNTFICSFNQITSINFTKPNTLQVLQCGANNITFLNVSNCPALADLNCSENNLTTLDLSNNNQLSILSCGENSLYSLDLSQNLVLTQIIGFANNITTLTLPSNAPLERILISGNSISNNLDFSNYSQLIQVSLGSNLMTAIDLSNNPNLESIYCRNMNTLTELNIANGNNANINNFSAINNPNLSCINIDANFTNIPNDWEKDSVAVYADNCFVGIEDISKTAIINAYPNPCQDVLYIDTEVNIDRVRVLDVWGREYHEIYWTNSSVLTDQLVKGVYILIIETREGEFQQKFIKG